MALDTLKEFKKPASVWLNGYINCAFRLDYRKVPKFSDARKLCRNLKAPNLREFHQKGANGEANSEDPDQTAPRQSDLGLHCLPTVCPDKSVRKTLDPNGSWHLLICGLLN